MRWWDLVCVSAREEIRFPSVLLQVCEAEAAEAPPAMTTVYRERHELLTAALVTRFAPHLELLSSHTGLHVAAKPGGRP